MDLATIINIIMPIITLLIGGGFYYRITRKLKQAQVAQAEVDKEKTEAETGKTQADTDTVRIGNLSTIIDRLQEQVDRLENTVSCLLKENEDLKARLRELEDMKAQTLGQQKHIALLENRLNYIVDIARVLIVQLFENDIEPEKELPAWAED